MHESHKCANKMNFLCIYIPCKYIKKFKSVISYFRKRKEKKGLFPGLITNGGRYFEYLVYFLLNIIKMITRFQT